ncbi:hypothetical protein KRX56_06810 [Dermabacteraceae bacterium TAE3-ERU27]|nr:hypothetical protein [Dermabacteraceae bacterium TAE3-ERU27]
MLKTPKMSVTVAATCALALGLTACGGDAKKPEYKADNGTSQSQQAEKKDEAKTAAPAEQKAEEKQQDTAKEDGKKAQEQAPAATGDEAAIKQRAVEILHLMGDKKFEEVCKYGAISGETFKDNAGAVAGCAAGMEKSLEGQANGDSALQLMKIVGPELLEVKMTGADSASVGVQGTELLKMVKVDGEWYFTA